MILVCKITGANGNVRELGSILDFNSEYCAILARDAVALGYNEGAIPPSIWRKSHQAKVPYVLDFRGTERAIIFPLAQISLGQFAAKDVDTAIIEMDFPNAAPFDVILGRSFLKNFNVELDMKQGYLTLSQ
jgi:hypothetical protein